MDLKVIYLPEAYEFMLNINSAASKNSHIMSERFEWE